MTARLQRAQIALAIADSGLAAERDERVAAARQLITSLRTQIAALPETGSHPSGAAATGVERAAQLPFAPTNRVPPEGLDSWQAPDPAGPRTALAGGLELEVVQRVGDWAHVRATNGWSGWVDVRRLVPRTPPAA